MPKTIVIPENEALYIHAGPSRIDAGYRYDFEVNGETVGPLVVPVTVKELSKERSSGVFRITGYFNPDEEPARLCDITYAPYSESEIKGMIYNIRRFYQPMIASR